jgi:predicted AlkP superfamily phosphohydrolase/phosphomutase|tara:strand:+ start:173 stop:493 length:321 start_codon:yes stop_codon:yes gene_type:complete
MDKDNNMKGLLLVPDGLVYPLFNEFLQEGKLPNISKYIYDRKIIEVENAFSCHPSSTFENMQAINTGMFPYDPGATHYSHQSDTIIDLLRLDNVSKGYCAKRDTIF